VIKVFVDMYEKGLIYRGKRLVNWDPHFETAISDLEVENTEVAGHMWHFKYPLAGGATYRYVEKDADGQVIVDEERDYISIATTRPETMLGDGAVAVHPGDERYKPIVGMLCEIPVGPREHRRLIPIITDEYPDPTFGSGAVKITGAHDFNDYAVAKRGGIPCYRLMDTRAKMRADGAPYAEAAVIAGAVARGERTLSEAEVDALNLAPDHLRGLDRFEARKAVVAEITAEGLAVMTRADDSRLGRKLAEGEDAGALVPLVEAKVIMQPFGDRSKVVIEPMLTDQWFVDAEKVVGPALEVVRRKGPHPAGIG
jgi:valyl-tRNA synthetase